MPPRTLKPGPSEAFDRFYRVFPKRYARGDAEKAWRQVDGDAHIDAILATLEWQVPLEGWDADDSWCPYPATWLRAKRWMDERPRRRPAVVVDAESVAERNAVYRARAAQVKWGGI